MWLICGLRGIVYRGGLRVRPENDIMNSVAFIETFNKFIHFNYTLTRLQSQQFRYFLKWG